MSEAPRFTRAVDPESRREARVEVLKGRVDGILAGTFLFAQRTIEQLQQYMADPSEVSATGQAPAWMNDELIRELAQAEVRNQLTRAKDVLAAGYPVNAEAWLHGVEEQIKLHESLGRLTAEEAADFESEVAEIRNGPDDPTQEDSE